MNDVVEILGVIVSWKAVNAALLMAVIGLYAVAIRRLSQTIEGHALLGHRVIFQLSARIWLRSEEISHAELQSWLLRLCLLTACLSLFMNIWHLFTFTLEATPGHKDAIWRVLHIAHAGIILCVEAYIPAVKTQKPDRQSEAHYELS